MGALGEALGRVPMFQRETYTVKLRRRALLRRSAAEQADASASGAELRRVLGAFDLLMLGIGGIIGATRAHPRPPARPPAGAFGCV